MAKMTQSNLNVKELKDVLHHIIATNKMLQAKGKTPVAINVVGPAGLGKTSTIKQVGIESGFKPENIHILNLSSLEEIGDLIGIPVLEYQVVKTFEKEGEEPIRKGAWIKEAALPTYEKEGWSVTSNSRMSYAVPEWIAGKSGPGILILDDYTRASQRFTQAVMELILTQSYGTWELPAGWTIVLSSNPDDGLYNVTDQDPAQRSRYMNVQLGWNAEVWAEWAEKNDVDGRCINFVLMNPEIIKDDVPEINARSITLFFDAISSIPNFESNLPLIQLLGEGSLGVELTAMFSAFINHNMDKIITIEEVLDVTKDFKDIEKTIRDIVKDSTEYRADIAFVLTTRLINHIQFNMTNDDVTDSIIKRLEELILSNVLGNDLRFVIGRKMTSFSDKPNLNKLVDSDEVTDMLLS